MNGKSSEIVSATKARQNFGGLLDRVDLKQEEFIIERDGRQMAKLAPLGQAPLANETPNDQHLPPVIIQDLEGKLDFRTSIGLGKESGDSSQKVDDIVNGEMVKCVLALKHGDSLFLDSSPLIYFWTWHEQYAPIMKSILDKVYELNIQCIVSHLTYIETIGLPMQKKDYALVGRYTDYFRNSLNVHFCPIDVQVCQKAAMIAEEYKLQTHEAMQLSIALLSGVTYFLTGNKAFANLPIKIHRQNMLVLLINSLVEK